MDNWPIHGMKIQSTKPQNTSFIIKGVVTVLDCGMVEVVIECVEQIVASDVVDKMEVVSILIVQPFVFNTKTIIISWSKNVFSLFCSILLLF